MRLESEIALACEKLWKISKVAFNKGELDVSRSAFHYAAALDWILERDGGFVEDLLEEYGHYAEEEG